MSYYGSSGGSSTLLDYYGGATGGSSRYHNIYGTTGSNYSSGVSAIDRYYSYIDEISSPRSYLSTTSSSSLDHYSMPQRYSSRYSSDSLTSGYGSGTSGYGSGTSGYGSGNRTGNSYASEYSSRYSRPIISRGPTYDKYGKELSNYDRWRVQHGEKFDSLNNNQNSTVDSSINSSISSSISTSSSSRNRRTSRIEDDSRNTSMGSGSSILNTSRELSVMPGATVSSYENDLSALPSRFANMGAGSGNSRQRGKSMAPSSTSSTNGYSASFGGKSNYGSSSNSRSYNKVVHSFPLSVSSKLAGYEVRDVKGDGGCYYRCLSLYFTGSEDNYNKYRREVVGYLREHADNYSSMIRSEIGYASTNDYFSRKMRTDHQEFAETTEIIATCCVYNINVHVLAIVPGKRTWEWLHFDPSIGSGKPSTASRDIYLYNQGSVHFMLCSPK